MNNLENIPACLRVIARQIEKGEITADTGVMSLRAKGSSKPVVFGFGSKVDGIGECQKAIKEINRLSSQNSLLSA